MPEHDTEEMRIQQQDRAEQEERLAEKSSKPEEEAAHQRRSDKARYLEEKLKEREQSERED